MQKLSALIKRHVLALWYVLTVILPVIVRTGRRPVIFSRFAGMGDVLGTFPVALELKKRHPGATFIYNCAASFACLPPMGGVTMYTTSFPAIGLIGHWYRFLLCQFYHFSYGDEFPHSASTEITIKEFGRPWNVEVSDAHPELNVDAGVVHRMKNRLMELGCRPESLIVIHPGPSWPVRTWPQEHWVKLLETLRAGGFTNVVQIGTSIRAYTNVGAEDFPLLAGAKSLVDRLTIPETIAVISLARLFVGIDSGLLHFAACLRIPSVGVFGATSPQLRFAPSFCRTFATSRVDCQGCHHRLPRLHWEKGCPYDIRCMKQISVAEVSALCLKQLPVP